MLYLAAVLHTGCLQCALFGCSPSHRILAVCFSWLHSFYTECSKCGQSLFFLVSDVHTGCFAVIILSCSRSHTLLSLHCGQSLLSFVTLSHIKRASPCIIGHCLCFSASESHTKGACPFIIRLGQCFRFPVTLSQQNVLLRALKDNISAFLSHIVSHTRCFSVH